MKFIEEIIETQLSQVAYFTISNIPSDFESGSNLGR